MKNIIEDYLIGVGSDASIVHEFSPSIEEFEGKFKIDISCGDGKYLQEVDKAWSDGELDDDEFAKYDGNVDFNYPIRDRETNKLHNKLRFTMKHDTKTDEYLYYINGKLRS